MAKNSTSDFLEQLKNEKGIPEVPRRHMVSFYTSYVASLVRDGIDPAPFEPLFLIFLRLVKDQFPTPSHFLPYHKAERHPFDYYTFGNTFLRPLIDFDQSKLLGKNHLDQIMAQLNHGENVVLFANHQTEPDPQAISLLLEEKYPKLAEEMIFVAGDRVVTDPLAIPFSLGRNLLCIYSKRYIDNPPEDRLKKQLHNKRTMELMSELLASGGKCIYVAPSGGRDRRNAEGVVEVAPFEPSNIEMFYLMAKKSGKTTHFYPLALSTYSLLPPPETIRKELGEERVANRGGVSLSFGKEIAMEEFPGSEIVEKQERRKLRCEYIWNLVHQEYLRCT